MPDTISIETAAMERQKCMDTRPQDRYAGRLKIACCRKCGSADGMQAVHRSTLAEMPPSQLNWIKSQELWWYREPGNNEYLYYPCPACNPDRNIPGGYAPTCDIQAWLDRDSMAPDYVALAAEPEAATAAEDSHESAGL